MDFTETNLATPGPCGACSSYDKGTGVPGEAVESIGICG